MQKLTTRQQLQMITFRNISREKRNLTQKFGAKVNQRKERQPADETNRQNYKNFKCLYTPMAISIYVGVSKKKKKKKKKTQQKRQISEYATKAFKSPICIRTRVHAPKKVARQKSLSINTELRYFSNNTVSHAVLTKSFLTFTLENISAC